MKQRLLLVGLAGGGLFFKLCPAHTELAIVLLRLVIG